MAQAEFVDLYALIAIEPSADAAAVRKRLTETYIDAQNNLDHRNASKRLQYQQMYEVYLPQARHLLLDAGRRAEYDRYLQAYKLGKPLSQVEAAPAPVVESGGISVLTEEIPEMNEPDVAPEVLAQQREELWGKWKSGLNFGEKEAAPTQAAVSAQAAVLAQAAPVEAAPEAAQAERRANPRGNTGAMSESARRAHIQTVALGAGKEAPKAARVPGQRLTAEELEKRTREEWERNREKQRTEIVNDALTSTRLMGSFIGGGGTFVVALILLFIVDSLLSGARNYPLGMSRLVFTIIGFVFSLALAAVGALVTSKKMGEKTQSQLQHLSLEELQRRGH